MHGRGSENIMMVRKGRGEVMYKRSKGVQEGGGGRGGRGGGRD